MEEQDAQTIWSWLESSGIAVAMREWTWLYPIVEIAHIIGFVVLVGAAFLFDLRLLGVSRVLPVIHLARPFITLVACEHICRCSKWVLDVHNECYEVGRESCFPHQADVDCFRWY